MMHSEGVGVGGGMVVHGCLRLETRFIIRTLRYATKSAIETTSLRKAYVPTLSVSLNMYINNVQSFFNNSYTFLYSKHSVRTHQIK